MAKAGWEKVKAVLSLPFFSEIKESEMEEVARGIQHFMEAISVPKRPVAR